MKKSIKFICLLLGIFILSGCTNNNSVNSGSNSSINEEKKADIHDIKTFREALKNWCKKNYTYDEELIKSKSSSGADDKMLKESYSDTQYLYIYDDFYYFYIDTSRYHPGPNQKEPRKFENIRVTNVACFNNKNDGNSEILYFEYAFVLKIEDEELKKVLSSKQPFKNQLYIDGYYYSVGQENTNFDFTSFLKDYVNGKY